MGKRVGAVAICLLVGACSSHADRRAAIASTTSTTVSEAAGRSAISAAIAAVEKYQLGSVPQGFGPGVPEAMTTYFTITYPSTPPDFGRRLSVQVVPMVQDPSTALGSTALSRHDVRNGKTATFFVSSEHLDDTHARHGLTWVETAKSRVTIYAYSSDAAFFVRLAESVRPYAS